MVDQCGKIKANCEDWKRAKKVVTKDRIRCTMNTFMLRKANGPDGIYTVSLQKRLGITINFQFSAPPRLQGLQLVLVQILRVNLFITIH